MILHKQSLDIEVQFIELKQINLFIHNKWKKTKLIRMLSPYNPGQ